MNTFGKNDKSRERVSFVIFDMLCWGKSMRIASSTPCHFVHAIPFFDMYPFVQYKCNDSIKLMLVF